MRKFLFTAILLVSALCVAGQDNEQLQYKLLATTKTSTMQKEIDQMAALGYRIIVGAPTSGSEMVLLLSRDGTAGEPYQYKLLATTRTGTMQKELNDTADDGFRVIPSTMIPKKGFLSTEIVVIMERPPKPNRRYNYRLLATNRTGTMQKEITESKDSGYRIVGMVSRDEHMVVMEKEMVP